MSVDDGCERDADVEERAYDSPFVVGHGQQGVAYIRDFEAGAS